MLNLNGYLKPDHVSLYILLVFFVCNTIEQFNSCNMVGDKKHRIDLWTFLLGREFVWEGGDFIFYNPFVIVHFVFISMSAELVYTYLD